MPPADFFGTIDARLIAIDAATGKVCAGFGEIDLTKAVAHFDEGNWQTIKSPRRRR